MSKNNKMTSSTEWYEYDWHYNNTESVFCVDLSYSDAYDNRSEQTLGDILVSVCCKTSRRTLLDSEYKRYESLRDKLIKKLPLTYVGLIENNTSVFFFFYAKDSDVAIGIDKCIKHIANRVSCECKYDIDKAFYKKTLLPDAAKLYTEENRKLLQIFERNGDCMSAPRKINFHIYFPSEPLRILFEEQARLAGYAIGISEFVLEQELSHGIAVHKILPLVKSDIDDATSRLIYIAEKYEGVLSFWDCILIPNRKSL